MNFKFDLLEIKINNFYFQAEKGLTIFQVCDKFGYIIPRFCYHEFLSIAGNCRMCLVEVSGSAKLVASCAMPLYNNIKIFTESNRVKLARESVLEYLLSNHPLDCPICDQGGECDLQDITISFGWDKGRFYELNKRAVEDKDFGPLIKTVMTRCIHCTRCIRFNNEAAFNFSLGLSGRGSSVEVGTYIKKLINSEISGNIIDLCPVGALTSKPYSFVNRAWELNFSNSIDILDSLGSNIRIDSYLNKIVRILPRFNSNLNEYWITDKIRFSYDFVYNQRLQTPWFRLNKNSNRFISLSWIDSVRLFFFELINTKYLNIIGGNFIDLFTFVSLKDFFTSIGCSNFFFSYNDYFLNVDFRFSYLLNLPLKNFEVLNLIFLLNVNLRFELPLLNYRIKRIAAKNFYFKFYTLGGLADYVGFKVYALGNSLKNLLNFLESKTSINKNFISFNYLPLFLFDKYIYNNSKALFLLNSASNENVNFLFLNYLSGYLSKKLNLLRDNWVGLSFLNSSIARINSFEVGFLPGINFNFNEIFNLSYIDCKVLFFFVNFDDKLNNFFNLLKYKNNFFIVYQGHHADELALSADLIFPTCTFFEKNTYYLNLTGNFQKTVKVLNTNMGFKLDWEILKILFYYKLINLTYNFSIFINFYKLFNFFNFFLIYKKFSVDNLNKVFSNSYYMLNLNYIGYDLENINFLIDIFVVWFNLFKFISYLALNSVFDYTILNYYQSDSVSKFSKTLNLCSKYFLNLRLFFDNNI